MTRLQGSVALRPSRAVSARPNATWVHRPPMPTRFPEAGPADRPGFRFEHLRVTGHDGVARTPAVESPDPVVGRDGPVEVTDPDDPSEIEADQFADAAVELLAPTTAVTPALPAAPMPATLPTVSPSEPEFGEEQDDDAEQVADGAKQSTGALPSGDDDGGAPVSRAATSMSGSVGVPLPAAVRERMEPVLGIDLGRVRIHTGAEAAALAGHFEARAFANRNDIFFASGAYAPSTRSGVHLLLHEVAHVVQNSGRSPRPHTVARAPLISGKGIHGKLEDILIEKHKATDLIAEGVLPAATASGKDLASLGYPDLYRSSAGATVPWVRGETQDDGSLKYVPTVLAPGHKHPRTHGGRAKHAPTVDTNQNFTGDFPATFEVAEIKPVGFFAGAAAKVGEGFAQSHNYVEGFPQFAKQARADGKSQTIPSAAFLTKVPNFLPPAIDYKQLHRRRREFVAGQAESGLRLATVLGVSAAERTRPALLRPSASIRRLRLHQGTG